MDASKAKKEASAKKIILMAGTIMQLHEKILCQKVILKSLCLLSAPVNPKKNTCGFSGKTIKTPACTGPQPW
jgi:hypothetical protein